MSLIKTKKAFDAELVLKYILWVIFISIAVIGISFLAKRLTQTS